MGAMSVNVTGCSAQVIRATIQTDTGTEPILTMTQGLVGWAGSPGLPPGDRRWAVCEKQVRLACA